MNTNPTPILARLYFGHARPDGGMVSPAEFRAFLADVVAPVLPGWTTLEARGGWRDATTGALVEEASTVLETFAEDAETVRPILERIAGEYSRRFRQDCVALAEVPMAPVAFIGPRS